MWTCRGRETGRRLVAPAIALVASLIATVAPASAAVLAFRTSDGSADSAFVKLGDATRVQSVVPDGARGVYLIGKVAVGGAQRGIVHVLPDGTADPAFRPQVRGGHVAKAAVRGAFLAVTGTFTSIGGRPRAGIAVLDARTGRPLAWAPAGNSRGWGDVLFAGATLVASAPHRVYAWHNGESSPAWTTVLRVDGPAPAALAVWRGSVMALAVDPASGRPALTRINAASGATRATGIDVSHVTSMQTVGGKLLGNVQGVVVAIGDEPLSRRLVWCGRVPDDNGGVVSFAGDGATLYVGDAPYSPERQSDVRAVTACPLAGGATRFRPPVLEYGERGPVTTTIALVGNHVLVFTR
jgi:hypothetical protein